MSRFAKLALDTETPRRMTIKHPATGEPMVDSTGAEAYLDLYSLNSRRAQKVRAGIQQRRIDARMRRVTLQEVEEEALAILAACVAGWHLVDLSGETIDVALSEAAAQELFSTDGMRYLVEQATVFADTAGNFLPTSLVN